MVREEKVREALGLSADELLQERGVYVPELREQGDLAEIPESEDEPDPGEVLLTQEWLDDDQLAEHFSEDPDLSAALPGARSRAKRLDLDPGVLVLEGLPRPANSLGQVRHLGADRWVMDSRREPAALVLPHDEQQIALWGEGGTVRLFALRSPKTGEV